MKSSIAIIKLVLRTNKKLADGTHPIMLRCQFKGRKEISTGYACSVKHWDAKNEMIKKGYPNYVSINPILSKLKSDAINIRDEFERKGIHYTPDMILKKREILSVSDNIDSLAERYIVNLGVGTKKVWKSFLNSFKNYTSIQTINEIDVEVIKGYGKYLEKQGLKESTIKMTLSKLAALCRYAVEEGIISDNPFKRFNYGKLYKVSSSNIYIHHRTIDVMKELFLNETIEIYENGDLWKYKDGIIEKLLDKTSPLFARYFWLLGLLMQGLAPIDLCQLKIKDLTIKNINGTNYYCWDLKRQKTKMPVKIRVKVDDMYNSLMIKTFLMFHNNKYLLPILDGVDDNDYSKVLKRVNNWISNHIDKFRDWLKTVNQEIVKRNVENNSDIPLAPTEASFYSYRHSFAQMYLSKGGNVLALATLLGRSMDTISTYVEQLTEDNDLTKAVEII